MMRGGLGARDQTAPRHQCYSCALKAYFNSVGGYRMIKKTTLLAVALTAISSIALAQNQMAPAAKPAATAKPAAATPPPAAPSAAAPAGAAAPPPPPPAPLWAAPPPGAAPPAAAAPAAAAAPPKMEAPKPPAENDMFKKM